jgi:hypothetical protein
MFATEGWRHFQHGEIHLSPSGQLLESRMCRQTEPLVLHRSGHLNPVRELKLLPYELEQRQKIRSMTCPCAGWNSTYDKASSNASPVLTSITVTKHPTIYAFIVPILSPRWSRMTKDAETGSMSMARSSQHLSLYHVEPKSPDSEAELLGLEYYAASKYENYVPEHAFRG